MKKIKSVYAYINLCIFVCLTTNYVNAQAPSAYLTNISVDDIAIQDCSTISFGTKTSISLLLKMTVTKGYYFIPDNFATFKIYRKTGSSAPVLINGIIVPNDAFTDGTHWEAYFNQTLYASDFTIAGTVFYGVYEASTSIKPETCYYGVTKAPPPSFTISPTNLNLSCGDTSSKVFTINPLDIPNGSSISYQWVHPGWNLVSSTTNSRTLVPISGVSLPSDVTVTPYLNGIAKPNLICSLTRGTLSNSAILKGNSMICSGSSNYTINNLEVGDSVTWSSSNNAIATVSNGTQTQITVNSVSQGLVDLIATITNPCGQVITKQKSIWIGEPNYEYIIFPNESKPTLERACLVSTINNLTLQQQGVTNVTFKFNDGSSLSYNDGFCYSTFSKRNTSLKEIVITSACGSIVFIPIDLNAFKNNNSNENNFMFDKINTFNYLVYPNPSEDIVNIELNDKNNIHMNNISISAEIFDMIGQSKSKFEIINNRATLSINNLNKGVYILKIYLKDKTESHKIIVK